MSSKNEVLIPIPIDLLKCALCDQIPAHQFIKLICGSHLCEACADSNGFLAQTPIVSDHDNQSEGSKEHVTVSCPICQRQHNPAQLPENDQLRNQLLETYQTSQLAHTTKQASKRTRRKSVKMALSRRFSAQSRAQSDMAHDIRNRINEINELRRAAGKTDDTIKRLNQQLAKQTVANEHLTSANQQLTTALNEQLIEQKRRENELKSELSHARRHQNDPANKELNEATRYVEQLRAELLQKNALNEKLKSKLLTKTDQMAECQQKIRELNQQAKQRHKSELQEMKDSLRLPVTPRAMSHHKSHSLSPSPSRRLSHSQAISVESLEREIVKLRSQVDHYKVQLTRRILQDEETNQLHEQQEQSVNSVALSLSQQFEERQDDLIELRGKVQSKQAHIWRLLATVTQKDSQIKTQSEQITHLTKVRNDLQERLDEMEQQNGVMDDMLNRSHNKLATHRMKNKKLQQLRFLKKCPVNGEFDKVNQDHKDTKLELQRLKTELEQKADECSKMKRQLKRKEASKSKKCVSHEQQIVELTGKLRANDHELMSLRSDLNQSHIHSTLLTQSQPKPGEQEQKADKQITKLKSELSDYKSRLKAAEKSKNEALSKLQRAAESSNEQTDNEQLMAARAQLQSAHAQIQIKENQINEIQNLLKECRTQLNVLTESSSNQATRPRSQPAQSRVVSSKGQNNPTNGDARLNGYVFGAARSPTTTAAASFFPAVEDTPLVNRSTTNFTKES